MKSKFENRSTRIDIPKMECQRCQYFLEDYLYGGLPRQLETEKKIKKREFQKVIPEVSHWILRMCNRVPKKDFEKAIHLAKNIARRGRKQFEYKYLQHTATFNLLRFEVPWIEIELKYLKVLFAEAGIFHKKNLPCYFTEIQEFIGFLTISCYLYLSEVHDDHINPKGLQTNVGGPKNHEETLYDRDDDYQKDILAEVSLEEFTDDLYT
jgi:hypothetical protein